MPRIGLALLFSLCLAGHAAAQDEMSARLSQERVGEVQPGTYNAGGRSFTLDRYDDKFLMRLSGDPEVYVLYADHAPLGGRALKYDSGATAIAVAPWGGMTLYTDQAPGGMPAERTGDTIPPSLGLISLSDVQNAADDEAQHLAYSRGIHLTFVADWSALAGDSRMRALCFDAMENAARGIDRFIVKPQAHTAFAKKIDQVRISLGNKPVLFLSGKTLNVTFNAQRGYAGRASSRGIARGLGELMQMPVPN
jgi:Domain of unknown function (DUF4908)